MGVAVGVVGHVRGVAEAIAIGGEGGDVGDVRSRRGYGGTVLRVSAEGCRWTPRTVLEGNWAGFSCIFDVTVDLLPSSFQVTRRM